MKAAAVAIPSDEAALTRGEHLVRAIAGCDGCHGSNLGGMALLEDPAIMTLYGPNLTGGEGGAGRRLRDDERVSAIRHGLDAECRPLLLMPAQNYRWMTDEDMGAALAYINSLPPVDNAVPEPRIGPMGYFLALAEPSMVPAALFDYTEPTMPAVEPSVSAEYGSCLVALGTCRDCHGEHLNGRSLPSMLNELPARNLTPAGLIVNWSEADFIQTIRTGVTPEVHTLQEPMAGVLTTMRKQTDDKLRAIFLYLQSLPPRQFGELEVGREEHMIIPLSTHAAYKTRR